ncbi:MAG: membrane protein insertase YidC [Ruminococcaceae bacterium]|nr:membrane protein insertase YidC [Oscillospiraceae bacterium]
MPLGYIMWLCYLLVNNFGWAIIIFTIIIKAAMFPLSLKQQKNMAKSQLFMPKVKEIQTKYRNNQEKMQEEMAKLQKEGYNPMGGCGTMLITFLILFGVIDVVYKPMTHMEHLNWSDSGAVNSIVSSAKQTDLALTILSNEDDLKVYLEYLSNPNTIKVMTQEDIDKLTEEAKETAQVQPQVEIPEDKEFDVTEAKNAIEFTKDNIMSKYGLTEEQWSKLTTMSDETVKVLVAKDSRLSDEIKAELTSAVQSRFVSLRQELAALRVYTDHKEAFSSVPVTQDTLDKLDNLSHNMQFAGLDLGMTPGFELPLLLIPILSLIMSLAQMIITQIIQNKTNPEMAAQQQGCAKFTLYLMPLFSLYIAFQVPAGVGFYWALNYVVGILQSLIIYKFWPNDKLQEQARIEMEKKNPTFTATATVVDIDEEGNEVTVSKKMTDMTSKELKEYQRRKLEEARKADAEKYGDEDIPDLPPLEEDDYDTSDNSSDSEENGDTDSDSDTDNGKKKKNKKIK